MTPQEAAALLAMAAAFDNRKPDADAAQAWALALDGLRFEDCREVLVQHYRNSRDWLMPSDITSGVKRLRRDRVMRMPLADPPAEVADDPLAYTRWLRNRQTAAADGQIEEFDARYSTPELEHRDLDVTDLMPRPPSEEDVAAMRRGIHAAREALCAPHKLPADSCSLCAETKRRAELQDHTEGDVA